MMGLAGQFKNAMSGGLGLLAVFMGMDGIAQGRDGLMVGPASDSRGTRIALG